MRATPMRQPVRDLMWPMSLAVAAVGGSWLFACVLPFAAFAAILAMTESRSKALGTVALIWVANQAVGYVTLGYPGDAHSVLWGLAIGAASLIATGAASFVVAHIGIAARWIRLTLAFAAAFLVYEAMLGALAVFTGETANFALGLVAQIAAVDAAWLAGLALLHETLARLGWPRLKSLTLPV
jgi:hypothetical protein